MPTNSRVVVVDDDDDVRETICELLRTAGYHAEEARDGLDALRVLRSGPPPCLVLLDLMMPVMSGWQFREEQLRDPELKGIPVIAITAARHLEPLAIPGAEILLKPLSMANLLKAVARHCPGPRARRGDGG